MESGLNSDTVQVEVLPDEIVDVPVFVDSTGKRHRRFRTVGFIAGGVGVAYAAMLGLSFAGGPIAPNALLPIPGVPTAAPLANPDKPESSMSAVSDEEIARGDNGNRGDRIDSTSTPRPGESVTGKPGTPTPKPPGKGTPTPAPVKTTPPPVKTTPPPVKTTPPPVVTTPPPVVTTPPPVVTTPPADPPVTKPPADPPVTKPPAADPPGGGGTGAGGGGSDPTKPPANDPPATNPPATSSTTPVSTTES